jgi:hypothetical protein
MTRDEDFLPLFQAVAEGKILQWKGPSGWVDWKSGMDWAFPFFPSAYRIKPEPLECWVVVDREGSKYLFSSKENAEEHSSNGLFAPYTIHHMREVTP